MNYLTSVKCLMVIKTKVEETSVDCYPVKWARDDLHTLRASESEDQSYDSDSGLPLSVQVITCYWTIVKFAAFEFCGLIGAGPDR